MTPKQAIAFIQRNGIVLERALIEAIVGAPVRGSWWAHPDAHHIFKVLGDVQDVPDDILRCRLVDKKITYAHRRVWPALVKLAPAIGPTRLDRHAQEHTTTGAHRTVTTPFPKWVPAAVLAESKTLDDESALGIVAPFEP